MNLNEFVMKHIWTIYVKKKKNTFQNLAHEIGHTLGMLDDYVEPSHRVRNNFYDFFKKFIKLTKKDFRTNV